VVMPGMSGPTLAAQLRHRLPGLKVILMSGYAGESIAQHGLPVADASFIQKPFKVRDLATRVWQLLHEGKDAPDGGPG
jgi:two-component system cell cycle sensor histidine kinase/response regulator CckA